MDSLGFLHAVEGFIGRDLDEETADAVIEMADEGGRSVQHVADLVMSRADFARVYGAVPGEGGSR